MEMNLPTMATNPPIPYSVYKMMADEEKYETLKSIAENAKSKHRLQRSRLRYWKKNYSFTKRSLKIQKIKLIFP